MLKYFAVIGGGAFGSLCRFVVATALARWTSGLFPYGTFVVNVTGSFLIGLLMTFFVERPAIDPHWRLLLVTGVLGGYTTFSSFEWETFAAHRGGATGVAVANAIFSVLVGLGGVWLGSGIAQRWLRT